MTTISPPPAGTNLLQVAEARVIFDWTSIVAVWSHCAPLAPMPEAASTAQEESTVCDNCDESLSYAYGPGEYRAVFCRRCDVDLYIDEY